MESAPTTASKRSRATAEQLNQMVDFMLANPGLAGGKFQKLHGKVECDKKWAELAELLNSLGGAVKSVDQWHTVWRDLKSRTSIKVRDRKRQQAQTGNRPLSQEAVTELERRVIGIIGSDYVEGHESVAENVPMDEELQLRLEDGDEDIVLVMPSSSSTPVHPSEVQCETPKTVGRTPRRAAKRKNVEDESDTKGQFLEIANKQADALKMLAESNSANVECMKMIAGAINTMGEGLIAVASAFNNLANSINAIL